MSYNLRGPFRVSLIIVFAFFFSGCGTKSGDEYGNSISIVNTSPAARISSDTIVNVGDETTLHGSDSFDLESDALQYQWRLVRQPSGSQLSLPLTLMQSSSLTFTPDIAGVYGFQLVVSDGSLSSKANSVLITALLPSSGNSLTSLQIESQATTALYGLPVTFGHTFAKGDVPADKTITGRTVNGTPVLLQLDKKATHSDGSLRHAVISAMFTSLERYEEKTLELVVTEGTDSTPAAVSLNDIQQSDFDTEVVLQLNNGRYRASVQELIAAGQTPDKWLDGKVVTEWQFVSPLKSDSGENHPHLTARFYVRAYRGVERIRVAVVVENGWTHVAEPQNFEYDVTVLVAGEERYSKQNVTHFRQARWRKLYWWGGEPQTDIRHDTAYLIASRAVPNYDQSLTVPNSAVEDIYNEWQNGVAPVSDLRRNEIMGPGLVYEYFLEVGGRRDIGPLPSWSALYLLSMDPRAKAAMLGTAVQAGSFGVHYRDKESDRPVTMTDYPLISILPQTYTMPKCDGDCKTPYNVDGAHQPSLAYLPYLVTGDYFFLEELQFWSAYNIAYSNPEYRKDAKGLVHWRQTRGQAWVLRTLGRTAYITPDDDEFKSYFTTILENNLDWYNTRYTNNSSANKLGINTSGYAFSYKDNTAIALWQDDFFTWTIGHLVELGFQNAEPLLRWKSIFPIKRMVDDGFCWIEGATYTAVIRDTIDSPIYETFGEVYQATLDTEFTSLDCASTAMANALNLQQGEMTGYSDSGHGYPSNMQPALAAAADSGVEGGQAAWNQFMSRTIKPDYGVYPNWAIVPRY